MNNIEKLVNKIPIKSRTYKEYNFTQAIIRSYTLNSRAIKRFRVKKNAFSIQNLFLLILCIFEKARYCFKGKNIEIIVISNTKYKIQKILDNLKDKKNIGIFQDYNHRILENYNHKNYHLINKFLFLNKIIKNFVKKKNYNEFSIFENKINFFENLINFYKPKSIYIAEGDSINDALIGQICKKNNIKCYCFQHGYNPSLFESTVLSKFNFKNYFYDFIFIADSYRSARFLKKKKLVDKYKVIRKKNHLSNLKKKKNIFFGIPTISPKENLTEKVIIKIAENIRYFSKKYNDLKILVRLHPDGLSNELIFDRIKDLKNIELHYPQYMSLEKSFETAKVSCFIYGTSLIADSINNNCYPIILVDKKKSYDYSGLRKTNVAFLTSSEKKFKSIIIKYIENSKNLVNVQKNIRNFLNDKKN